MKNKISFWKKYSSSMVLFGLLALSMLINHLAHDIGNEVSYSEFFERLKKNEIDEVVLHGDELRGYLKEHQDNQRVFIKSTVISQDIAKELGSYNVKFWRKPEGGLGLEILRWVLPLLGMFLFWSFIAGRIVKNNGLGSGYLSVGKSKAKIYMQTDTKITFDSVAGADEAKTELKEIVDFLREPEKYRRFGSRMPRGILLVGPPGCGKTLIAKAIAGEAKVPFFFTNGAEFVEMFVGVGAARVRDLFEKAKEKAPCIIFIDELDALGKARTAVGSIGGNDEKEQTLNQLLVELDGFDSQSGIIILAATNRPEILDPALLRSGRFDKQVLIDKPDRVGRLQILKLHVKKIKINSKVNLEHIAALAPGFSGADLENLVNEASLIAVRRNAEEVEEDDFMQAIERIVAGLEKRNRLINPEERKIVAFHEMGHTIVSRVLFPKEAIHKVSIIPRGIGSLGYTISRPTEDRYLMSAAELRNKMVVLMGGKAAESIIFQSISTGAADDIAKATDIARSMVVRYGMSEKLGDVTYEQGQNSFLENSGFATRTKNYSDGVAEIIDEEIKSLLGESMQNAKRILSDNKVLLEKAAGELLTKETLSENDIAVLVDKEIRLIERI